MSKHVVNNKKPVFSWVSPAGPKPSATKTIKSSKKSAINPKQHEGPSVEQSIQALTQSVQMKSEYLQTAESQNDPKMSGEYESKDHPSLRKSILGLTALASILVSVLTSVPNANYALEGGLVLFLLAVLWKAISKSKDTLLDRFLSWFAVACMVTYITLSLIQYAHSVLLDQRRQLVDALQDGHDKLITFIENQSHIGPGGREIDPTAVKEARDIISEFENAGRMYCVTTADQLTIEVSRAALLILIGDKEEAWSTIQRIDKMAKSKTDRDKLNIDRILYSGRFLGSDIGKSANELDEPYISAVYAAKELDNRHEYQDEVKFLKSNLNTLDTTDKVGNNLYRKQQVARLWMDLTVALDHVHASDGGMSSDVVAAATTAIDRVESEVNAGNLRV